MENTGPRSRDESRKARLRTASYGPRFIRLRSSLNGLGGAASRRAAGIPILTLAPNSQGQTNLFLRRLGVQIGVEVGFSHL
jgi:hypothetical protein